MKITKREIVASITIIALMLLIGSLIGTKVQEWQSDDNAMYNDALRITDTEMFKYAMSTSVGNAFVYGDLEAIDIVTFPEIEGQYLYVKKVREEYTMHTKTVTTTDRKGHTSSHTETYYTWDEVSHESKQSNKVKFCGSEFKTSQFYIPMSDYITTKYASTDVRYKFYGYQAKSKGTIFAFLCNNNIPSIDVHFYKDMSIEQTVEQLTSDIPIIFFWILWIVLTAAIIYGFYYLDNNWLNS